MKSKTDEQELILEKLAEYEEYKSVLNQVISEAKSYLADVEDASEHNANIASIENFILNFEALIYSPDTLELSSEYLEEVFLFLNKAGEYLVSIYVPDYQDFLDKNLKEFNKLAPKVESGDLTGIDASSATLGEDNLSETSLDDSLEGQDFDDDFSDDGDDLSDEDYLFLAQLQDPNNDLEHFAGEHISKLPGIYFNKLVNEGLLDEENLNLLNTMRSLIIYHGYLKENSPNDETEITKVKALLAILLFHFDTEKYKKTDDHLIKDVIRDTNELKLKYMLIKHEINLRFQHDEASDYEIATLETQALKDKFQDTLKSLETDKDAPRELYTLLVNLIDFYDSISDDDYDGQIARKFIVAICEEIAKIHEDETYRHKEFTSELHDLVKSVLTDDEGMTFIEFLLTKEVTVEILKILPEADARMVCIKKLNELESSLNLIEGKPKLQKLVMKSFIEAKKYFEKAHELEHSDIDYVYEEYEKMTKLLSNLWTDEVRYWNNLDKIQSLADRNKLNPVFERFSNKKFYTEIYKRNFQYAKDAKLFRVASVKELADFLELTYKYLDKHDATDYQKLNDLLKYKSKIDNIKFCIAALAIGIICTAIVASLIALCISSPAFAAQMAPLYQTVGNFFVNLVNIFPPIANIGAAIAEPIVAAGQQTAFVIPGISPFAAHDAVPVWSLVAGGAAGAVLGSVSGYAYLKASENHKNSANKTASSKKGTSTKTVSAEELARLQQEVYDLTAENLRLFAAQATSSEDELTNPERGSTTLERDSTTSEEESTFSGSRRLSISSEFSIFKPTDEESSDKTVDEDQEESEKGSEFGSENSQLN